jgi:hypothetical protein
MALHTQANELANLLDTLIAVDLELEPLGRAVGSAYPARATVAASIRQTCDVLRSSIADLRSIILDAEGLSYLPPEKPARRRHV